LPCFVEDQVIETQIPKHPKSGCGPVVPRQHSPGRVEVNLFASESSTHYQGPPSLLQ